MGTALAAMYEFLRQSDVDKPKTVILFTDGQPEPQPEVDLAREWARNYGESGISLNVLGFGNNLRLHYSEELATLGRGVMLPVDNSLTSIEGRLQQTVEQAQVAAITNARLELTFPETVKPSQVYRGRPQIQLLTNLAQSKDKQHIIPIGSLDAAEFQSIFIDCTVIGTSLDTGRRRVVTATLVYDVPSQQQRGGQQHFWLDLPVAAYAPSNPDVAAAYAMAHMKPQVEEFQRLCSAEDWPAALEKAAAVVEAYRLIDTSESAACADLFKEAIANMKNPNVQLADVLDALNRISVSSSTASASGDRVTEEFSTQPAAEKVRRRIGE